MTGQKLGKEGANRCNLWFKFSDSKFWLHPIPMISRFFFGGPYMNPRALQGLRISNLLALASL